MSAELEYEIDNIGGVEHLKLKLAPGVSVLRAPNGSGKTSAINAVARAQGAKVRVEKRDGAEYGFVRGPGVKLAVRAVPHATGEAEVELAETGPLAKLIDPGLKDPEAAARMRIRALVELLGLGVEDAHLEALCGENKEALSILKDAVRDEAIDDLMSASEKLRGILHALARSHEREGSEAESQARIAGDAAEKALDDAGEDARARFDGSVGVDSARLALDDAIRKHERATARTEAREKLERQQNDIRSTLGPRPDLNAALAVEEKKQVAIKNTAASIAALEEEIRDLRSTLQIQTAELEVAAQRASDAKADLRRWEDQQAILDTTIEDAPSREELDALHRDTVASAADHLRTAELAEIFLREEKVRADAERIATESAEKASELRALASEIPSNLGEILERAGAPGLTVKDGRLHAIRGKKAENGEPYLHDFETRCSTGQRVSLALDVAAQAYEGKVLPLDGALWAALDEENRRHFAKEAEERGLFVITEEPADGELRVERAGA